MRAWHFSENAYPYLPPQETYPSIRVSLPNRIYDPVKGAALYDRYIDEWLIDVLSHGRLEAGFVRGVPYEILPANSNPVRMNERHWEALDLIVKAWTHHDGPFSFEGRFFHHRSINIWPRCYQQPHPPIWVSTTSTGGAQQVGAHGYIQATFLTGFETTKRIYE